MTISWSPKFEAGPSRNLGEDLQWDHLGASGAQVLAQSPQREVGGLRDAASSEEGGRDREPRYQGHMGHKLPKKPAGTCPATPRYRWSKGQVRATK